MTVLVTVSGNGVGGCADNVDLHTVCFVGSWEDAFRRYDLFQ